MHTCSELPPQSMAPTASAPHSAALCAFSSCTSRKRAAAVCAQREPFMAATDDMGSWAPSLKRFTSARSHASSTIGKNPSTSSMNASIKSSSARPTTTSGPGTAPGPCGCAAGSTYDAEEKEEEEVVVAAAVVVVVVVVVVVGWAARGRGGGGAAT
jgi:cobalamin biosynthesis Mg chelatase CobN